MRLENGEFTFADFAMKVIGEIRPQGTPEDKVYGNSGQWLMSCTGHSFSKRETR